MKDSSKNDVGGYVGSSDGRKVCIALGSLHGSGAKGLYPECYCPTKVLTANDPDIKDGCKS